MIRQLIGVLLLSLLPMPGVAQESWSLEHALPAERLFALRPRLDAAFVDYLEYRIDTRSMEPDDAFLSLYFTLLRFLDVLSDAGNRFAHLVERSENQVRG